MNSIKVISKSVFCFFIILLIAGNIFAGEKIINVYTAVKIFPNPSMDSVVLLEFPIALKRNEFEFFNDEKIEGKLSARVYAQVDLIDTLGQTIDSSYTYFAIVAATKEEAAKKNVRIFSRLQLLAKPGIFLARITVIDVVNKNRGEFFIGEIIVDPIYKAKLTLSDIYLAYNIDYVGESLDTNSKMVKNGYRIYPNPPSIYGTNDTSITIYTELYNLDYNSEKPSKFQLTYVALNQDSSFFMFLGERQIEKIGSSAVIVEEFDIKGWPVNIYAFQMIALDKQSKQVDTTIIPFAIIEPIPDQIAKPLAAGGDPYDRFSLKQKIDLVKYVLNPEHMATLNRLTDEGKNNYLNQYWAEHDSEKNTPENESRLELIERFYYVNQLFSNNPQKNNGWQSDQGRIYLTYGPYEEIDEISSPRIGNPYVVWYYRSIAEGKLFVFEDWSGNFDFRLVHSNVFGEPFSKIWEENLAEGQRMDIE